MKKFKIQTHLISMLFVSSLLFACAKKDSGTSPTTDTTTTTPPTDGSQSVAQLAGTGTFCNTDSTIGGAYAYTHSLTLNADGTYGYSIYFSDAASCATAQNTGGNNYATYTQAGTFTVGGTATTPSTGTKITFTVGSASLIIRSLTYGAIPQNLANWMSTGGHCAPNPGFSASADQTKSVQGNTCVGAGSYSAVVLPAVGDTFNNVVYSPGTSMLNAGVSSGQDTWRPGGSSFPTSYTQSYLSW